MPFAQYGVQAAFMNVRPGEQTDSVMFTRILTCLWPEVTQLGINTYGDFRDLVKRMKKFFNRDHIVRGTRLRLTQRPT